MTMCVNDDEQEVNVEDFLSENEFVEVDSKYFSMTHQILSRGVEGDYGDVSFPLGFNEDGKYIKDIVVSRQKIRPEVRFEIDGNVFVDDIKFVQAYDIVLFDKIEEYLYH